ncbi:hypothetical protein [Clostridium senegalense]|uniref:Uncharacterized protein n=1 Tax=Clostridium senegalense TaxID=1465809 RepID=A0A6M0H3D7_9CLOT|nr:hypothetical protein [Clostridium senegalense]NEU04583.1 hypothetical protein [Clostridium senegalense]
MNHTNIKFIVFISGMIAIISYLIGVISKITIPAISPISLAVLMAGLIYLKKQQFKEGNLDRNYYLIILFIGSIGIILNIYTAISQLIIFLK